MHPTLRRVTDIGAAGLVVGLMLAGAALSDDEPARAFDGVLIGAVVVVGSWTAVARRSPRVALVGAVVSLFVAYTLGVPAFPPALALGVPLMVAALAGHLRWAVAVVAALGATSVVFRPFDQNGEPLGVVLFGTLFDVALMALLVLLGDTVRSRRAAREEAALRARLAEAQQRQRLGEQRLRVARDLHDVLAHTLTVVGIQAGVAAESLEDDRDGARDAVGHVRLAVRDAMADLRGTIDLLRADAAAPSGTAPAPTLDQLPDLLDRVRAAGIVATLTVDGQPTALRAAVEVTGYRVVQEALTNVLRHARARTVAVVVRYGPDAVCIEVRDDGEGPETSGGAGSGLHGMAERVAAVGGSVRATPAGDGRPGFAVRARIPVGAAP